MSTPSQRRNNLLVGIVVIMASFLADIQMDWLSYGYGDAIGRVVSLAIPGTPPLPVWLLLSFSALSTLVIGLNLCRITSIHRWVLTVALMVFGSYYTLPFFTLTGLNPTQLYAGPYVALAATMAALALVYICPQTAKPLTAQGSAARTNLESSSGPSRS